MRESICTIPISEIFEVQDGCPICRMYNIIEERIIDYIMGDAMMEPDVRIETNKAGFCLNHYDKMMSHKGRLQLALMLETHLKSITEEIFGKKLFNTAGKKADKIDKLNDSCFICNKIEWGTTRLIDTIYRCYEKESDFRQLFNSQPQFCMPHYKLLASGADKHKMPRYYKEFEKNLTEITENYAKSLCDDVSKYCSMYDYRNNTPDADWGNSKDSVERAIKFLR